LTADISVDPNAKPATSVSEGQQRTYTVKPGDSLSQISKELYGTANEYMKMFEANRDVLSDPNKIGPGQTLKIPS
jgi:nucleoid-associated protein YgaU